MTSIPRLLRCAPYFPVADVDAAAREYGERFGFATTYLAGTPGEFAIVSRDGLDLMLRRVADPQLISVNTRQGGTWDVFFWIEAVDALFAELRDRKATVIYPPTNRAEYHMREFAVQDSVGYVLGFGESIVAPLRDSP